MAVSKKINEYMKQGSWIRRMFEEGITLKKEYGDENIFDLSLGNPIMEPPAEFMQALRFFAEDPPSGMLRYMPNAGYAESREAVAYQLLTETGIGLSS